MSKDFRSTTDFSNSSCIPAPQLGEGKSTQMLRHFTTTEYQPRLLAGSIHFHYFDLLPQVPHDIRNNLAHDLPMPDRALELLRLP